MQGRSLTDFVVSAAHDAAQQAIEEQTILGLSAEDQRRFAEALIQPPAPNAALNKAKHLHLGICIWRRLRCHPIAWDVALASSDVSKEHATNCFDTVQKELGSDTAHLWLVSPCPHDSMYPSG